MQQKLYRNEFTVKNVHILIVDSHATHELFKYSLIFESNSRRI